MIFTKSKLQEDANSAWAENLTASVQDKKWSRKFGNSNDFRDDWKFQENFFQ